MLDRQSAIELILDRYEQPLHRGTLPVPPALRATDVNARCGDTVTMFVRVRDGVVHTASFEGGGCTVSQAAADVAVDLIVGRRAEEVLALTIEAVGDVLGAEVLRTRPDCASLGLRVTQLALRDA